MTQVTEFVEEDLPDRFGPGRVGDPPRQDDDGPPESEGERAAGARP